MRSLPATMPLLLCALLCATPGHAWPAAVTVKVTDGAGQPLADAVVTLETNGTGPAARPVAPVEISQSKRQFHPALTVITVGTAVRFPNFDTVRHHVYSFSPIKTFELKLYAGVPDVPVVFDKPGAAALGCNIHDRMSAWVVVVGTPFYGRTTPAGDTRLNEVPAGHYELRVWHAGLAAGQAPVSRPFALGTADVSTAIQVAVVTP